MVFFLGNRYSMFETGRREKDEEDGNLFSKFKATSILTRGMSD